ncbi:MAG: hypothetical protein KBC02_01375 [Candidatus Pacebacteria bacterium]|nr:hypothetical protein [Candidatus Paceibacterota bacterium]
MTKRDTTQPTVQQFLGLRRTALAMGLTRQQILRGRDRLETALSAIQMGVPIKMLPHLAPPLWGSRIAECAVMPFCPLSVEHVMARFPNPRVVGAFDSTWRSAMHIGTTPLVYVFVERDHSGTELMAEVREWALQNDLRLTNAYDLVALIEWCRREAPLTVVDSIPLMQATQPIEDSGVQLWPISEPRESYHGFDILPASEIIRKLNPRWYVFRR